MKISLLLLLPSIVFGVNGPKYTYPTPRGLDDEMHNIYNNMPNKAVTPSVYIGSGAPSFVPPKVGDLFISTSTSKVYLSTSAVTTGSWAILN